MQIYCDLDDVLTNFDESASQAIGVSLNRVSATTLWDSLKKKFSFFETLAWKKGTCERVCVYVCERLKKIECVYAYVYARMCEWEKEREMEYCSTSYHKYSDVYATQIT